MGEDSFPTRLLNMQPASGLASVIVDPNKINQHIQGLPDPTRAMTSTEVRSLLKDPFARQVLREGIFPANLTEIHDAFDAKNSSRVGLPHVASFVIAEGGQIPFEAGVGKGSTRLISVRAKDRQTTPDVLISTLVPAGVDPRSSQILNEVLTWDDDNQTFHFYQRQGGAWFWCGQSDMALVPPTRGEGAFDSHINGYPLMKELRTPWVHWHGPSLSISEVAYAADDPMISDSLFRNKLTAIPFEVNVIGPLMERWNQARFDKHVVDAKLTKLPDFFQQLLVPTSANLISSHAQWEDVKATGQRIEDVPTTFFFDHFGLAEIGGLRVDVPPLEMDGQRYAELVTDFDLRVIGNHGDTIDMAGDVPFTFTVPERAHEDHIASRILVDRGVLSNRLAACLLMVDFPNPVRSERRAKLLEFCPDEIVMPDPAAPDAPAPLDAVFVDAVRAAAPSRGTSPLLEFLNNWDVGPDNWRTVFEQRVEAYLELVSARLGQPTGSKDYFRLAESRRRDFRQRPLAEFGLSLPQAKGIAEDAESLSMTEQGRLA